MRDVHISLPDGLDLPSLTVELRSNTRGHAYWHIVATAGTDGWLMDPEGRVNPAFTVLTDALHKWHEPNAEVAP